MIERKLKEFPYLNVYIVTANHHPRLASQKTWFESQVNMKTNITYISGLVAGSERDMAIQIRIDENGKVKINALEL